MKKIVSLALFCSFAAANIASAQLTEADDDMVEGLRQLVLADGKSCSTVTDLQPEGTTAARLTCQISEGGNSMVVYLIQVDDNGLVITEE